jgi:integrase
LSSLYVVLGWLAPGQKRSWFKPLLRRLAARAEGVMDKRQRLRRSHELFGLGEAMMAAAEDPNRSPGRRNHPRDRARLYRDGLMIAFLAMRPMRLANLIGMVIGQHLVKRSGRWWIEVPGEEVKTGAAIELPFPATLVEPLQRYLAHWRPQLAADGQARQCPVLWLSEQGRAMSRSRANTMINRRTAAAFGLPVNPHLFRDALATTVAVHRPDEVRIVSRMLGHNAIATAERFYNQARQVDAARNWHACMEEYGHKDTPPPSPEPPVNKWEPGKKAKRRTKRTNERWPPPRRPDDNHPAP